MAVVPQPDFAPFCVDRAPTEGVGNDNTPGESGGVDREIEEVEATGVGPSLAPLPSGAIVIAEPPERRSVGRSCRSSYQRPRSRRLSPSEREAVCALAPNRSLREVAADFGVSHETIRSILRDQKQPILA